MSVIRLAAERHRPRWYGYWRLRASARNPRTFNEKIRYKAAFDRRPILTTFADKIAVRDYIAGTVGRMYLTESFLEIDSPAAIDWASLPREYVCKVNHLSGGLIMVSESADVTVCLPEDATQAGISRHLIHPSKADPERMVRLLEHWLTLDYSWNPRIGRIPEWCYQDVSRGVLIEEVVTDRGAPTVEECKLFVFNGRCRFIQYLKRPRDSAPSSVPSPTTNCDFLTPEWGRIPVHRVGHPWSVNLPPRPARLDEMIDVAERLAEPVDFVRVDFLVTGSRIVVGELTNYPNAGAGRFDPVEYDVTFGSYWTIDY